ncbi:DUF1816 domain-containing protein [Thermostichus vulcanus]|uniref:DUF1816 domain-containing protein n=1 Tax=Thermostichus vulcanus str. 'Rupite' TaxID=2813851 RepID=A0ABT0CB47_THEVL|nr:DUF1816 domain-containing protein [Thermostichus vulcanus]MCJ2543007.1 DUF1816 domain-containing protein [Thermostichus vulcanus str. 'Rupite']
MDPVSNPLANLLDKIRGLSVWIEITTEDCTYYYGPFSTEAEAEQLKGHYIADLKAEGSEKIQVLVKKMRQPESLTVARTRTGARS